MSIDKIRIDALEKRIEVLEKINAERKVRTLKFAGDIAEIRSRTDEEWLKELKENYNEMSPEDKLESLLK